MRRTGMTLNELMIVVLIVSVTAGLAIPTYVTTVERARGGEASATLRLLDAAEKVYHVDEGVFTDLTAADSGFLVAEGYVQDPNADPNRPFDYSVSAVTDTQMIVQAVRIGGGCNNGEDLVLWDTDGTITAGGTWTPRCP